MELLKVARRRSFLSEVMYVLLNALVVAAIVITVIVTAAPWYAFLLIALSKWRVFAVRTRFWAANIRANMVDTIVGLSTVILVYTASGSLLTQIILGLLYLGWLLLVKPRSSHGAIVAQGAIGLFLGICAIMQLSANWPASLVVLLCWAVGYSAARHILSVEHETHLNFLSLLWGFIVAEIAWLSYHWTIGYNLPGHIKLPQGAVIIALLGFLAERVHASYQRDGKVQLSEVLLPTLLSVGVIAVILFVFGSVPSI